MEHLPIHLAYEAKVARSVQYCWMYPFKRYNTMIPYPTNVQFFIYALIHCKEHKSIQSLYFHRFLHCLKQKVKNRAHVETSIVEAYIIEEVATFYSLYFDSNIHTRLNQLPKNDGGGELDLHGQLIVFSQLGRPFGSHRNRRYFHNDIEY